MRVFAYLWIRQGGHEEKFFLLLCEGGMSLNGSTSSTQTPVNMKCSACCNKESKRAVRRIVLELSTGKHRSLPSATGRFVLMIFSKVSFIFLFFFGLRPSCMYFFCFGLLAYHAEKTMYEYFHDKIHLSPPKLPSN